MCGAERDQACAAPPTCLRAVLEATWLDGSCAMHRAARLAAAQVDWVSCSLCSPEDYCESSSCMFCAPGVLVTANPTIAYYGSSVTSADVCANGYLDARNTPLCPCLLPADTLSLGWLITIAAVSFAVTYVGGGWGALAHPDGEGSPGR